jgi:hypothetical protein
MRSLTLCRSMVPSFRDPVMGARGGPVVARWDRDHAGEYERRDDLSEFLVGHRRKLLDRVGFIRYRRSPPVEAGLRTVTSANSLC